MESGKTAEDTFVSSLFAVVMMGNENGFKFFECGKETTPFAIRGGLVNKNKLLN